MNQKGLFHQLTTRFRMPVKRSMTSGPCQETSYNAITLNPESHFTRREKNHSLFHWNTLTSPELRRQFWMLCKKAALMIIGTLMALETCLILGQVSLSLLYWKKNLQKGQTRSGERLTKRQATSRPDQLWPELWRGMSKNTKLREKHKWAIEKPKLDNARNVTRNLISLTLRTWISRKSFKMQEERWLPPCLARHARKARVVKPAARLMISSVNLHVSWKPVNPGDRVWKNLYRITMRTILQEKVAIHHSIIIWFTNLFLCLKP